MHEGSGAPLLPRKQARRPDQLPSLAGASVSGDTSVAVATIQRPPAGAGSDIVQRPLAHAALFAGLPEASVETDCSPRKPICVAAVLALVSMAKNSMRKLAGPCVSIVHDSVVVPPLLEGAEAPWHGPDGSLPRQIRGADWPRLA